LCTGQAAHIRQGYYRVVYSLLGMWRARRIPVDSLKGVYAIQQLGGQPDERFQSICGDMHAQ
jgi:hypothetical protein